MARKLTDKNIEDSFVSEMVGLPTRSKRAPRQTSNIDPTGFGSSEEVGFFADPGQVESATKGIRSTGAFLAKQFAGLRPRTKKRGAGLSSVSAPTNDSGLTPIFENGEQVGLSGGLPTPTETMQTKEAKRLPQAVANFGLPTDRLPSIEELGGALGGIAKYVSQLTKRNRARGLSPGAPITKTIDRGGVGLTKAKLSTLTKQLEIATLAGDSEKSAKIEAQLSAILQGNEANAFADEEDIAAIAGL